MSVPAAPQQEHILRNRGQRTTAFLWELVLNFMYNTFTRKRGSRSSGSWSDAEKLAVWQKGTIDPKVDSSGRMYRQDACGKLICFLKHGQEVSEGWEIDHIEPLSKGGSDHINNLQPLFWETNREKADTFPWSCK
jgi:hypothetical protein